MGTGADVENRTWWKEAVVYQVYPRSFMDGNGDGIGDLPGLISKLDYLKWLGVDVIWLSPIYQSPNDDMGYDISNYCAIMDEFGTMDDFAMLLNGLHERGMKLVMDLVVNHTSDEHEWFLQSRADKESPYRDYYIWRPGNEGRPPNNWGSFFSGSVWELDEQTKEYYLHLFSVKQPDLNWENPKVRAEIYEMMRWWLDKGVDGFRMDVINCISKEPKFPDAPNTPSGELGWGGQYFFNGPRIHEYLQEMNREVLSKYDAMTVGETLSVTPDDAVQYVGFNRGELNMVFQFELMDIDSGPGGKWDVQIWSLVDFKRIFSRWQVGLHSRGWNSLYLNNHDQPRLVSRFGNDREYRTESAKMLATLLHTLQGTPFVYQGEEIGMTNVRFDRIEDYRDIETLNWYKEGLSKGRVPSELMPSIYAKGRDNARTPMQWTAEFAAGFSTIEPWIQVNPNYPKINAEREAGNPNSIVNYYRQLIELRKQYLVIVYGDYTLLNPSDEQVYAFKRQLGQDQLITVLNFTSEVQLFKWEQELPIGKFELLLSNYSGNQVHGVGTLSLRPYEARVYLAR